MTRMVEQVLDVIYSKNKKSGGNIISILQDVQDHFGYLPEEVIEWFAEKTGISASRYFGVATFYSQFHLNPRGKNIITVCSGTVCHVKGAPAIVNRLRDDLKLKDGEDTTGDMKFTLESVNCVGACSIAPVVLVNSRVFGKQSPTGMVRNMKQYKDNT